MLERYLNDAQQKKLLDAAGKTHDPYAQRDHAWMRALLYSGCRISEFSMITVAAAQHAIDTRRLVIPREHRKGQKRDHAPLATAALIDAFADLLRLREILTGQLNSTIDTAAALVVNRYGAKLSVRSYQKRMHYWGAKAGIELKVSPHWLRHTRAKNIMAKSGAQDPRGIVQRELGHVSIASTTIYTAPGIHEVRSALERTDATRPARKRDAIKAFREARL